MEIICQTRLPAAYLKKERLSDSIASLFLSVDEFFHVVYSDWLHDVFRDFRNFFDRFDVIWVDRAAHHHNSEFILGLFVKLLELL